MKNADAPAPNAVERTSGSSFPVKMITRVEGEISRSRDCTSSPFIAGIHTSITAMGPSTFLRNLYDLDPEVVANTLARQATSINKTVEYVLDRLSINAPGFVSFFKTIGTPRPKGSER